MQRVLFCRLSRVCSPRDHFVEAYTAPSTRVGIPRLLQNSTNEWVVYGILLRCHSEKLVGFPCLCNESLYDGEDGGRTLVAGYLGTLESRGAVHKHNNVLPHSPERCRERTRGVNVYQLHRPLGARRRVMDSQVGGRFSFSIKHAEHETSSQLIENRVVSLSLATRSHGHGRGRHEDG